MIRTIVSAVITLALIIGVSIYESHFVKTTFELFRAEVHALKQKTELGNATYSDGLAIRSYWDTKKHILHVWITAKGVTSEPVPAEVGIAMK